MASKRTLVSTAIIIMTEDEDFGIPEEDCPAVTLYVACSNT